MVYMDSLPALAGSPKMACRMQQINPIELNFTFPENGCRSDLTIYHHPAVGQQRSIFGCDWDERELIYDCDKLEPGVSWDRPDPKHTIITLPGNFEQNSGHFRYQISCHDSHQENTCSWDPVVFPDKETADHTMRVESVTSTTAMRTEYSDQQDSNQYGNQAVLGLVGGVTAAVIVILVLVLILIILVTLLHRKHRVLKGMIRATDSKLQRSLINTKNRRTGESETQVRPKMFWSLESNPERWSEIKSLVSRTSTMSFKTETKAEGEPQNLI